MPPDPPPAPESGWCAYGRFQEHVGEVETDAGAVAMMSKNPAVYATGVASTLTGLKDKYIGRSIQKWHGCK